MRAVSATIVALGFLIPGVLHAQEPTKIEGVENYCFFNGKIYSVGAVIRPPSSNVTMICVGPEQGANKTERAVWTLRDRDRDRERIGTEIGIETEIETATTTTIDPTG